MSDCRTPSGPEGSSGKHDAYVAGYPFLFIYHRNSQHINSLSLLKQAALIAAHFISA